MVPEGWKASQVGDVATFFSGGTPSKKNAEYWGGNEPWISGKDLKSHYLNNSVDSLTDEGFAIAKKAPQGASLILVRGMTLLKDFPVGYASRELAFNQDVKALVPNEYVDGLFLSYMLVAQKNKIKKLVSIAGHGTGRLDTNLIKEYPVNLPPLPEQKKIAEILSTWDQAIAATERLLDNSRQRKKALMQQLLTGKKRLPGFEGEWDRQLLGVIAKVYQPKTISQSSLKEDGYPVYGANGLIGFYDDYNHENEQVAVTCRGSTCGLINWTQNKSWITGNAMVVNVDDNPQVDKRCFYYILSRSSLDYLVTGSGQPQITGDIKRHEVLLPSINEQRAIAEIMSAADQEITFLESRLDCLTQEKKALMQQLLTGKRRVKVDKEVA